MKMSEDNAPGSYQYPLPGPEEMLRMADEFKRTADFMTEFGDREAAGRFMTYYGIASILAQRPDRIGVTLSLNAATLGFMLMEAIRGEESVSDAVERLLGLVAVILQVTRTGTDDGMINLIIGDRALQIDPTPVRRPEADESADDTPEGGEPT
jgi:hypothetical protein